MFADEDVNCYSCECQKSYLQCAPLSILCSITARIGAIPVPGPTQIMGTSGLVGNLMSPFLIPMWRRSPNQRCRPRSLSEKDRETDWPGFNVEIYEVQTPFRGILNFVRYFTIATQRLISRGCFWYGRQISSKSMLLQPQSLENYLDRTCNWKLPGTQGRKYIENVVSRNLHVPELSKNFQYCPAHLIAVFI